jgi:hypothetical protein
MNRISILVSFIIIIILQNYSFAKDKESGHMTIEEPLTKEKSMVVFIRYGNGYIDFGKTNNNMAVIGEFTYKEYRPDVEYETVGNEGRLDIRFSGDVRDEEDDDEKHINSFDELYDNELILKFSPKIPLSLELDFGVVKGDMNFGGLKVSNFNMEVGVSKTDIYFDEPNPISMEDFSIEGGVGKLNIDKIGNANIQEFTFDGGIGSYELDFTGDYQQSLYADIELGMGKLVLYLPKDVGTRLSVDKSFLSSFSIDEAYKNGDVYTNDKWEKTKFKLDLDIETGLGKIEVLWVD